MPRKTEEPPRRGLLRWLHMARRGLGLLLPVLIPSWRFFRAVAASPRVEMRLLADGPGGRSPGTTRAAGDPDSAADGPGDWRAVCPEPRDLPWTVILRRMVWNPRRNAELYLVSLSERVVEQGSHRAAHELLARVARTQPGARCQVRLVFVTREGEALLREVLYESAPFGPGAGAGAGDCVGGGVDGV